jgi:hypothetical protein
MSAPSAPDQPQSQPDGPVTFSQMNQMMNQMLQQVLFQQQENIQQQVSASMENIMQQYQQQQNPSIPPLNSNPPQAPLPHVNLNPIMSSNSPPLPSSVKISSPNNFTGARTVNVESWLFEMNRYLTVCGVIVEHQKISIATSYLKDIALKWWENYSKRDQPDNPKVVEVNWQAFVDAMKERFQPLAASRTARTQLRHLYQGNMSVADYSSKFYSLVQLITDMGEADQVDLFVSSLRSAISREVDMKDPKTLNEAMTLAQKMETLLDNRRRYTNHNNDSRISSTTYSTYRSYPNSNSSSSSKTFTSSSSPMELGKISAENSSSEQINEEELTVEQENEYQRYLEQGENVELNFDIWEDNQENYLEEEKSEQLQALQPRKSRAPNIPIEEFTRCMKNRLCLRCKKPGHVARNCPLPPSSFNSHPQPKQNFH